MGRLPVPACRMAFIGLLLGMALLSGGQRAVAGESCRELPISFLPASHETLTWAEGIDQLSSQLRLYLATYLKNVLANAGENEPPTPRAKPLSLATIRACLERDLLRLARRSLDPPPEPSARATMQQVWWKAIADTAALPEDATPQRAKPLIALICEALPSPQRLKAFKTIVAWGALLPALPPAHSGMDPLTISPSWVYWQAYLLTPSPVGGLEHGKTQLWQAFLAPASLTAELWCDTEQTLLGQGIRHWLALHHRALFMAFLQGGQYKAARLLCQALHRFGLVLWQQKPLPYPELPFRFSLPLLKDTLALMVKTKARGEQLIAEQSAEESWRRIWLRYAHPSSFGAGACLPQRWNVSPWTGLAPVLQRYCELGKVRNRLLALLGADLRDAAVGSRRGTPPLSSPEVIGILRTLRVLDEHYEHEISAARGFQILFFAQAQADDHSLLLAALRQQTTLMVSLMLNLLPSEEILLTPTAGSRENLFHTLLAPQAKKAATDAHEDRTLALCQLLVSALRPQDAMLRMALRQKNQEGATPLYLAAQSGQRRVVQYLQGVLQEGGAYDEQEHGGPALNQTLLAALERQHVPPNRAQRFLRALAGVRAGLRVRERCPLPPFSSGLGPSQAYWQNLLDTVAKQLCQAEPRLAGSAYTEAFARVYDHLQGNNKAPDVFQEFYSAPLSVQLSYFEPAVRLILAHMKAHFPHQSMRRAELYGLLCGRHEAHLPLGLRKLVWQLVEEELS